MTKIWHYKKKRLKKEEKNKWSKFKQINGGETN